MSEENYILEMNNICKNFGTVKALDNAILKVRERTVHTIMGENGAGKSTLMKCLFGIYKKDEGEILFLSKQVSFNGTYDAIKNGISMIHQELHPQPFLSVQENIWLGRFKTYGKSQFINYKKMYDDTRELFERLNINIDPNIKVKNLSVSQVQLIEIAKAVSCNSKVIIMDEPTSSLTQNEVEHLFRIIRDLLKEGLSIIYISHKMEEIFKISDDITVMRDGQHIGTWKVDEVDENTVVSKMVGRQLSDRFPPKGNTPSDVILKVEKLTSANPHSFKDVSFELKKGEILGISGLVGSQRTELIESIFGILKISSGKIIIKNKEVKIDSPNKAIKYNLALLTEERRADGIIDVLDIEKNIVIASLKKFRNKFNFVNDKMCRENAIDKVKRLRIKTPSIKTKIKNLSGGNQQKVLFARWLLTDPDILFLDEPTRGIDVGAKYEIYTIISELAQKGKSFVIISSEMSEIIGMCDRVMVMHEGSKSGEITGQDINEEKLIKLATKFTEKVGNK